MSAAYEANEIDVRLAALGIAHLKFMTMGPIDNPEAPAEIQETCRSIQEDYEGTPDLLTQENQEVEAWREWFAEVEAEEDDILQYALMGAMIVAGRGKDAKRVERLNNRLSKLLSPDRVDEASKIAAFALQVFEWMDTITQFDGQMDAWWEHIGEE